MMECPTNTLQNLALVRRVLWTSNVFGGLLKQALISEYDSKHPSIKAL
jgi:hypothetical protein